MYIYILVACNNAVVTVCFAIVHIAHVGSYLLDRPPSPERRPVGQSEKDLHVSKYSLFTVAYKYISSHVLKLY